MESTYQSLVRHSSALKWDSDRATHIVRHSLSKQKTTKRRSLYHAYLELMLFIISAHHECSGRKRTPLYGERWRRHPVPRIGPGRLPLARRGSALLNPSSSFASASLPVCCCVTSRRRGLGAIDLRVQVGNMLGSEVNRILLAFGIVEWRFDQDTLREITAVLCIERKQTRASALTLLPAPIEPGKVGERHEKDVSYLLEEFEEAYGEELGDEYADDIAAYVMEVEAKILPREDISTLDQCFIDRRAQAINELGRAWSSFKTWLDYSEETLWIAVNIFDRYFAVAKGTMTWNGCCLLTLIALFMAAKYWEVSLPGLDNFAKVVGLDYSQTRFRRGEELVLKSLDYVICGGCSPWFWLNRRDRRQQRGGLTEAVEDFLVQLAMRDPRFSAVLPSMVAATVTYAVSRMELTDSIVEKGREDLEKGREGFWRRYEIVELERGTKLLVEDLLSKELKASWVYRWYRREERHGASEFAVRWAKVHGDGMGKRLAQVKSPQN